MKVAYFLSHPVQYQSPLLRHLASAGLGVTTVYSDVSTAGRYFDPDYQQEVSWEQPLLEGYPYEVLPSPRVMTYSPWSWKKRALAWLRQHQPDMVWVHGWGTAFALGALLAAQECGLPILLRAETHLKGRRGSWLWRKMHKAVLSRLFTQVDQFLAIGSANVTFYHAYGVEDERISLVPYVTDNTHFQAACARAHSQREALRGQLGLSCGRLVLLFVGRLSPEKGLETLLQALRLLDAKERPYVLLAGEGPQSRWLYSKAAATLGDDVRFLGFVSQSRLPALYDLCDALVLPSLHEPWGMVVNEVMNAGRPVILSDRVGSAHDLLRNGDNGLSFPAGNATTLAGAIRHVLREPEFHERAGALSLQLVSRWNTGLAVEGLQQALARVAAKSADRPRSWTQEPKRSGIELAYIGVHEVFQLAIAAQEMGQLRRLQCSLMDAPGKLGRLASRFMRLPSARPLGSEVLPPEKIIEQPLPLLTLRLHRGLRRGRKTDPLWHHRLFETTAARHLAGSDARVVVGSETCALGWFEAAKKRGMKCLLDCHGIPTPFLDAALRRAAAEFGLPLPRPLDTEAMAWHKRQERELADVLLFCSDFQQEIWIRLGVPSAKCQAIPLWIDPEFWKPRQGLLQEKGPLNIVAVGAGTLAKGLPYLVQAVESLGEAVKLTLVGGVAPDMAAWLTGRKIKPVMLPHLSHEELRQCFSTQHLLIMPSLGDSFGFVAMEAMASGLPVVVTDHCGVPVPDPVWRVPAFNSSAIARRVETYLQQPDLLAQDGLMAAKFASTFTPERYRAAARRVFESMMASSAC